MANRRMIARNVALSKKLAIVKWPTEVLYYRGLPFTDDAGRMTADPEEYRALLIPLGKNGKTIPRSQIEAAIKELYEVGLIGICECSKEKCLEYTSFTDHQTIKKEVGRKSQIHCLEPVGFQWFPTDSKGNPVRARGKGIEFNLKEGNGNGAPARKTPPQEEDQESTLTPGELLQQLKAQVELLKTSLKDNPGNEFYNSTLKSLTKRIKELEAGQ